MTAVTDDQNAKSNRAPIKATGFVDGNQNAFQKDIEDHYEMQQRFPKTPEIFTNPGDSKANAQQAAADNRGKKDAIGPQEWPEVEYCDVDDSKQQAERPFTEERAGTAWKVTGRYWQRFGR